ncbi:HWE histidine kinase domain-containing protein [Sphingomonas aquatilis]
MIGQDAERAAVELARQALALLDSAQVGDTAFAARLSSALDAVGAKPLSCDQDGVAIEHHGEPSSAPAFAGRETPGLQVFTTADGRALNVAPAAVSHITVDGDETVLLLLDGTEERLRAPFSLVAERLGLSRDDARTCASDGVIAIDAARHQLRNLLAIVSALIRQALDGDRPALEAGREVAARIAMLTRIADLMLQPHARFSDLETLVRVALAEGGTGRIRIKGPALPITSANGAALALALHELEVHALSSGALTARSGYVEVSWEVSALEEPYLWLQWAERDGPRHRSPLSEGLGKRLLLTATPRRLRGQADIQELPSGLIWSLHAPIAALCA